MQSYVCFVICVYVVLAKPRCPRDFTMVNNWCLYLGENPLTHTQAAIQCATMKARLAEPKSEVANRAVTKFLTRRTKFLTRRTSKKHVWLGASDEWKEGSW